MKKSELSTVMLRAVYMAEAYLGTKPTIQLYDPADEMEEGEVGVRLWGARFLVVDENGDLQRGRDERGYAYSGEDDTPEDAVIALMNDLAFTDVLREAFRAENT